MDLEGIDKQPMDTSITKTNTVENTEVTKHSILEALQPPNGDREELLDFPIDEEIREAAVAHNLNSDSHLESNILIIENQNNENLERDSELMDNIPLDIISKPANTESGSKNDSSESAASNSTATNTSEHSSDLFAQNEQIIAEQQTKEDDYLSTQKDTENSCKNARTNQNLESEKAQVLESMNDNVDAIANSIVAGVTEGITDEFIRENPKISSEIIQEDKQIETDKDVTLDDKLKDFESEGLQSGESSEHVDNVSIPPDHLTCQDGTVNIDNQLESSSTKTFHEIRDSNPELPASDNSIHRDISDKTNDQSSNLTSEELCETELIVTVNKESDKNQSENKDPQSSEHSEQIQDTDPKSSEIQNEEPCTNNPQSTVSASETLCEGDPQSTKTNAETCENYSQSTTTRIEMVCETSSQSAEAANEDLCDPQSSTGATQFEQVNLDGSEHENTADLNTSESLAHDILQPNEVAEEPIEILPDSEREITQAEKEAASSLPTLKDIAEKAKTPDAALHSPEIDAEEGEIKIYEYDKQDQQECCQCKEKRVPLYHFTNTDQTATYICEETCLTAFKNTTTKKIIMLPNEGEEGNNFVEGAASDVPPLVFIRKCFSCGKKTDDMEKNLNWEIMDFCNEFCLSKYQKKIGSKCVSCQVDVKATALGKYCVRFGNDIRQFCSSPCLEQYKKGLKVCSYCQQDMSQDAGGFLAPVGEKGQFKDFCSKICMEKYDIMTNDKPPNVQPGTKCSVCKAGKILIEFEFDKRSNYFCGEPCFVAFTFVNKISPEKCVMCRRHFNKSVLEKHTMYYDNVQYSFCSNSCENIYIIANRKIVPCSWCKVKKYNFDMIKKYSKTDPVINVCSLNCLHMYKISLNARNAKPSPCILCKKEGGPPYYLTMSDASLISFCSYGCVLAFQNQSPKKVSNKNVKDPVPKSKKVSTVKDGSSDTITKLPVISNVQSLASTNGAISSAHLPSTLTPISSTRITRSKAATPSSTATTAVQSIDLPVQVQVKHHYIVKTKPNPEQRNVAVMCQPRKAVKSVQTTPVMKDASVQTQMEDINKMLLPIPVPIYVPAPCHMYSTPVPFPVPFPLPIPIPIFIPTTRNSAAGIMKEIKKIQVKIPTDPYEAELLMMAEMVAGEKKEDHTDSESDIDESTGDAGDYSPEPVDTNNTFGDDMLQMALKMATELDEPAVDLEGALTASTITAPQGTHPVEAHPQEENVDDPQPILPHNMVEKSPLRGRKRGTRGALRGAPKRGRRMSHHQVDLPLMQPVQPPPPPEPQEKPDANMCLKYTFGVNAWKQWVTTKNAELEKSTRRVKLFKTEILQLTADELNYSLCLFVKEVRKPNGQEYAPDTIYYLCLGIQQYLFENGRIDNIFCDPYYEKFTDCLDEVAKKFSVLYNDSHYIVTRVEEEHLWESKQLGAHSPHVLLSTLMFFNTKHFNLTSVDEHMQLSFSHIMKHWKRNPNQPGASKVPGSRNVLLRFYPPQSALQNNQRKKKVYEQQENEENPLRCPVKLYEFYLSKCPESVKTRNDVFYLQPERSCVPDSPVWYSTMPLPREALEKMLHRVKMVKEINVALLTT